MRSRSRFEPTSSIGPSIVVQRQTRIVLAGNHTLQAARRLGWTHIAVDWTDAEGESAMAVLIANNRTSDLANTDADRLLGALGSMHRHGVL